MRALSDKNSITTDVKLFENIPTAKGLVPGRDWLESERYRLLDKGVSCEIVVGVLPSGEAIGYIRRI